MSLPTVWRVYTADFSRRNKILTLSFAMSRIVSYTVDSSRKSGRSGLLAITL